MRKIFDQYDDLIKLDQEFLSFLATVNKPLLSNLLTLRDNNQAVATTDYPHAASHLLANNHSHLDYSAFIVKLAPYLDDFIEELFSISVQNNNLKKTVSSFNIIFEARRKFVERLALRRYQDIDLTEKEFEDLSLNLSKFLEENALITQTNLATKMLAWLEDSENYSYEIDLAAKYSAFMVKNNSNLDLFSVPHKINPENKISQLRISKLSESAYIGYDYRDSEFSYHNENNSREFHREDGSAKFQTGGNPIRAQVQSNYCIYCHQQSKDYCRKGFKSNTNQPPSAKKEDQLVNHESGVKNDLSLAREPETKNGCPLDQKISEMNLVRSLGYNIGALAVIMIENPLVAITGHRICNDCSKACIFQKQDPVNIPMIETDILYNVLNLPYGPEIYYLLTQWNPLKVTQYLPKDPKDKSGNVLVVGAGPAGFALSYYLLRDGGHNVLMIDGLKILPLETYFASLTNIIYTQSQELAAGDECGAPAKNNPKNLQNDDLQTNKIDIKTPIKDWSILNVDLSKRLPQGFGGVAEYGITHRWNKNLLLLIRIILERHKRFRIAGSNRLGSNITINQALDSGIDHIALCIGTGKPKYLANPGFFLKGVKSATDFLMQLNQGAAYSKESNSNLQIRLPVAVYGAGLTAIDSAVEVMNYYPELVKNFAAKFDDSIKDSLSPLEQKIADEYLSHAKEFAKIEQTGTNIKESEDSISNSKKNISRAKIELMQKLGGVTLYYRGNITNSAAYKLNHEEIEQALSTGIWIKDEHEIEQVYGNDLGEIDSIKFVNSGKLTTKTLLLALGTESTTFPDLDGAVDTKINLDNFTNSGTGDFFTRLDRKISYFGDCNPKYHGSVVKAVASAKNGYNDICDYLNQIECGSDGSKLSMIDNLFNNLSSYVIHKRVLGDNSYEAKDLGEDLYNNKNRAENKPNNGKTSGSEFSNWKKGQLIEITINSPNAALNVKPGQFFRVQNHSNSLYDTMEPLPLTPISWDGNTGNIKFIVKFDGVSSSLTDSFKPGEKIALMGPIGTPTYIPKCKNIIFISNSSLGVATILPIAKAMFENGCKLYLIDLSNKEITQQLATNQELLEFVKMFKEDYNKSNHLGNSNSIENTDIVYNEYSKYIRKYFYNIDDTTSSTNNKKSPDLSNSLVNLELANIDHIYMSSSTKSQLEIEFQKKSNVKINTLINVPMQCAMKGICGQCVVRIFDGSREDYIFACAGQELSSEVIDCNSVKQRNDQNSLLEKLSFSRFLL